MKLLLKSAALAALLSATALSPAAFAEAPPSVAAPATDGRLIAIDGSNNFRDIGGYKTTDGREVRRGLVFRSGAMNHLTPAGFAQLKALGIQTNVDFRSTDERAKAPVNWPAGQGVVAYTTDYKMDMSSFGKLFASGNITAETVRAAMAEGYRDTPFYFAPQYRLMIRQIIEGRTGLVYNCTAGKDRTGVGTAILLTLLGVPRETVTQDYLLSNTYFKPEMTRSAADKDDPQMAMFMRLPADVQQALMGVDKSYLDASFAAINEREGGWDRYVRDDLGLSATDVAALKTRLLK